MQLFGSYTSPYVRHCRIALAQTGTDYEFVETDHAQSAQMSPTSKVPFLKDGDTMLTDSTSILRLIRENAGTQFLPNVEDQDLFALIATTLDSTINVFLLENDGFGPDQIPYVQRQNGRIESSLIEINSRIDPEGGIENDANLRCACFIDWAIFRNRIDFSSHGNLTALLDNANSLSDFTSTAPPK